MSLSLSKDCSLRSSRATLRSTTLTLVCPLSLLQTLHSTITILGFKWRNHGLTPVLMYLATFLVLEEEHVAEPLGQEPREY